jgi:hypothetical protein
MSWAGARLVTYGFLLGTAGLKILTSKDAKTAYTHITAAVFRGADSVMKTAETLKENCGDIAADAKAINEKRAEAEEAREIADAKAVLERAGEKAA